MGGGEKIRVKGRCNKPLAICWSCANTHYGACPWFSGFKPVPGWTAVPTKIKNVAKGGDGRFTTSYDIIACPLYLQEK